MWAQRGQRMSYENEIETHTHTHTHTHSHTHCYVSNSKWEPAVLHGELNSVLCSDLEGTEGG